MTADTTQTGATVEVYDDPEALARATAELIVETALTSGPQCAIALSGGSTPKRAYEVLATPEFADRMPWEKVHWFWGDERFVPHDSPDSNYHMARTALFDHVPVPQENIHPIAGVGVAEEAAAAYEQELKRFYGSQELRADRLLFDLQLLGIGEDGHTASLIPGAAALEERVRWVVAITGGRPETRITLTYPPLNNSKLAVFLAAGDKKRPVLEPLLAGRSAVPASGIRPAGELRFMLDRAAAPQTS